MLQECSQKSLVRHLASSSSIDSNFFKNLWKYRYPRRDNIIWVIIFGPLNCAKTLQEKLPNSFFLPQFSHYAKEMMKIVSISFFIVTSQKNCGESYSHCLTFIRTFVIVYRKCVAALNCAGPQKHIGISCRLMLSNPFFQRFGLKGNSNLQDKWLHRFDRFVIVRVKASSWCSLSKIFFFRLFDSRHKLKS